MTISAQDSALFHKLFGHADLAALFSDSATVRAMMLVEGALARVQGQAGIIPEVSAAAIDRAAMELQIDPAALADRIASDGVPVPALLEAFRSAMNAPDHAQYLHWGATSQDIVDTALTLRLRRALEIIEAELVRLLGALADMAGTHADLPMAARTYGQVATPTTFGAVAAEWGDPLLRLADRLAEMRPRLLVVSLTGAAGTSSALGPDPHALRAALAGALGLGDPGATWHAGRDRITELGDWLATATGLIAKIARDMERMAQSGRATLSLGQSGGSSTMPQKQNPVAPAVLIALNRQARAQAAALHAALSPAEERDGGAWFTEWLCLPPLVLAAGRSLSLAADLVAAAEPRADAMAAELDGGLGLIDAEAWSFALSQQMPRPEAQNEIKRLCGEVQASGRPLAALIAAAYPGMALNPAARFGTAPKDARDFAARARKRTG